MCFLEEFLREAGHRTCYCNKKSNLRISKPADTCRVGAWHLNVPVLEWLGASISFSSTLCRCPAALSCGLRPSFYSTHKAVVAFSRETQWAGHSPEHLHEEEAVYGPANQSRPLGRVGNGPWEAAGSPWGAGAPVWQWMVPCCRRNALGSAPAVSPGSLSALRLPFPSPRWSLR